MIPRRIIGVMSGSSLDGLDLALCVFRGSYRHPEWSLDQHTKIPFPEVMKTRLANAHHASGFELMQLDADFGSFIGQEIKQWMDKEGISADSIASHGHTVFHEPALGFTTQIGSGSHIAHITGIDTITSFRNADVAAGGQGAPFAPIADKPLFPGYDAYLNLGGIANVHITTDDGQAKAWDIGPCNQALNFLAAKLGKDYDANGDIASTGKIIEHLVSDLISKFPFKDGSPLGLSNEMVRKTWISMLDQAPQETADLLATAVEAIAQLTVGHISPFAKKETTILVTGGGAHNAFLMHRLQEHGRQANIKFELPEKKIIDYKECVLMAYLGFLTSGDHPYGIHSVTGATSDTIGGALHKAVR